MYIHGIGRIPAEPCGAADDRADRRRRVERVAGDERSEVRTNADRPDTRAAAAMGDAEGLVQIQVADVGAELAGAGMADQRVEIGAVDVHLATGFVDQGAEIADLGLEHAVRGRVRDHDRGEPVTDRLDLRPNVVQVDVALVVARHHDHAHSGHHRAGGVRAVGAGGDQADRAVDVAS